jgi:diguanylate cyclase (GGDEF)-like protein
MVGFDWMIRLTGLMDTVLLLALRGVSRRTARLPGSPCLRAPYPDAPHSFVGRVESTICPRHIIVLDQSLQAGLLRSPLFRDVPASLVSSLAATCQPRALDAQEMLLKAGVNNDRLYIVMAGCVGVRMGGRAEPHVRLGPGECVGELSILDGRPTSADVVAEEPTIVLSFGREQVWTLIDASAELARNLLRLLAGRVRHDDVVIGEANRLQRYFERIATMDGLTGLRNRRWLDDAFARQLDRAVRSAQPVSVLMIDLDHFKRVNDEHGHLVGDAVLCWVGQVLTAALRPQDLLARYGGEEFAVLLPGFDTASAVAIAERLRRAVADAPQDADAKPLPPMTVSIGVSTRRAYETLPDLLRRADEALYRAKEEGRNCVRE